MAVSVVVRSQGGQPAAVFYPFGHPTPYAYEGEYPMKRFPGLKVPKFKMKFMILNSVMKNLLKILS
jgi:hypothetical protein